MRKCRAKGRQGGQNQIPNSGFGVRLPSGKHHRRPLTENHAHYRYPSFVGRLVIIGTLVAVDVVLARHFPAWQPALPAATGGTR